MGKSKKPKAPVNLKPEFVLPKDDPQRHRKKQKNPPGKPQPEWMFPPDEQNPVLNPKTKTEEQLRRDKEEHDASIDYLRRKSVAAPMRAPPPSLLLVLVGGFLSSYGFDSASRLYTTQLQSRMKLNDWKLELGAKLPRGFPSLVKIFKEWHKEYELKQQSDDGTSSSDTDNPAIAWERNKSRKDRKAGNSTIKVAVKEEDETSSSGESDSSEEESSVRVSNIDLKDAPLASPPIRKSKKSKKAQSVTSMSTSISASDSDADEEEETTGARLPEQVASQHLTVDGVKKNAKDTAKLSDSSSTDSDSDSAASSSDEDKMVTKKSLTSAGAPATADAASSNSSSSSESDFSTEAPQNNTAHADTSEETSSDSDSGSKVPANASLSATKRPKTAATSSSDYSSDSDFPSQSKADPVQPPSTMTISQIATTVTGKPAIQTSDSSETLQASSGQKASTANTSLSSSSSPSLDASASAKLSTEAIITTTSTTTKRKRSASPAPTKSATKKAQKKSNSPFQRVPADTDIDPKLASNAYQPYDYAHRAHQDLSVTKGKGFTKEKNKKKRGSYRGGVIDIEGGKGVRFDE